MSKFQIKNVRLSFPSLFQKASYQGVVGKKYEATFIIEDKETVKKITNRIAKVKADNNLKVPESKLCLKNGDDFEYDGYAGNMVLKASSYRQPKVVDKRRNELDEDSDIIYSGCYVNAMVEMVPQDNTYGKRINCTVIAVQFASEGEPFGNSGGSYDDDDFDAIDDEGSDEDDDFDDLD